MSPLHRAGVHVRSSDSPLATALFNFRPIQSQSFLSQDLNKTESSCLVCSVDRHDYIYIYLCRSHNGSSGPRLPASAISHHKTNGCAEAGSFDRPALDHHALLRHSANTASKNTNGPSRHADFFPAKSYYHSRSLSSLWSQVLSVLKLIRTLLTSLTPPTSSFEFFSTSVSHFNTNIPV